MGVGFGIGIGAAVAYFLGAKKEGAANRASALGLLLSAAHGAALCGLCMIFAEPFVRLFTDSEAVVQYSLEYFYVVIAFAPVITLEMAFEKILQAVGKMKTTMFCMAIGAVINIVLDPLFISGAGFIPAMGVWGAALATGIGQSIALACYAVVFFKAKLPVRLRVGKSDPEEKICRRLYRVGVPAALNLALPSFLITALNAVLAAYSETYVLILGIYYKLQTFIYFTVSGIIQGIRPLVGYNLGAGRGDRVLGIFRFTLLLSVGVMAVGTLLCLILPEALIGLFTVSETTRAAGRSRAAHNKRGLHRVRPVRSYRRHVRGAGQRHAVADHFPDTLSGHYPRRSADDAAARRRGRMERVLDHRMHSRRIFLPYVRKVFQNAENENGSRVTRFRSFIIRPC